MALTDKELANVNIVLNEVRKEIIRMRKKHKAMRSLHEGWGLIDEEMDEFKEAVRANDAAHAFEEIIQVAALSVALVAQGDKEWTE